MVSVNLRPVDINNFITVLQNTVCEIEESELNLQTMSENRNTALFVDVFKLTDFRSITIFYYGTIAIELYDKTNQQTHTLQEFSKN